MLQVPQCIGEGCLSTTIFVKGRQLCCSCYRKAFKAGTLGPRIVPKPPGTTTGMRWSQSFRKPTAAESVQMRALRAELIDAFMTGRSTADATIGLERLLAKLKE